MVDIETPSGSWQSVPVLPIFIIVVPFVVILVFSPITSPGNVVVAYFVAALIGLVFDTFHHWDEEPANAELHGIKFDRHSPMRWAFATMVGFGMMLFGTQTITSNVMGTITIYPGPGTLAAVTIPQFFSILILYGGVVAFCEAFIFRNLVQKHVDAAVFSRLGGSTTAALVAIAVAIVVTNLEFSAAHVWTSTFTMGTFLWLFFVGCGFSLVYYICQRDLIAVVFAHGVGYNCSILWLRTGVMTMEGLAALMLYIFVALGFLWGFWVAIARRRS